MWPGIFDLEVSLLLLLAIQRLLTSLASEATLKNRSWVYLLNRWRSLVLDRQLFGDLYRRSDDDVADRFVDNLVGRRNGQRFPEAFERIDNDHRLEMFRRPRVVLEVFVNFRKVFTEQMLIRHRRKSVIRHRRKSVDVAGMETLSLELETSLIVKPVFPNLHLDHFPEVVFERRNLPDFLIGFKVDPGAQNGGRDFFDG